MIRWRGQNAVYTPGERQIVRQLPVREQFIVHTLKAFTPGEIHNATRPTSLRPSGEMLGTIATEGRVNATPQSFTDPEDIPFGKPKRRPRLYGLVATPKLAIQVKTKAEGQFWMKVWRKWYELKGWSVYGAESNGCYFAVRPLSDATLHEGEAAILKDQRHAISLHQYDKETKERLP